MAEDKLRQFEAILGAVSKIATGDEGLGGDMVDAKCPQCRASDFAEVSDLYTAAVGRIEDNAAAEDAVAEGGLTNGKMVRKFKPPTRKSPALRVIFAAVLFGTPAFFVHKRFGDTPGQFAYIAAGIITIVVLLTSLRKFSDEYYAARKRWRHLYMCRKCGQLVAP